MATSPLRTRLAALAALVFVPVLPACGGDDEASTAAQTEAAAAPADARLEPAAWDEYVALRDEARTVNEKAIERFRACRRLVFSNVPSQQVEDCLAGAAHDVVDEGEDVIAFLDGVAQDVGGACAGARTNLRGNVKIYIATVNQIALSIDRMNLPTTQMIESSLGRLASTRAASSAFERACKPTT
jgi:sarcosine oxidase delta subunit